MKSYNTNATIAGLVFILLIPFFVISAYSYLYIDLSSKKEFKTTMSRFTANVSKANIETPLKEIRLIFRSLSVSIDEVDIARYINGEPSDLNTVIPAITDSTIFFSNVIISDPADNYRIYPAVESEKMSPRSRPWYPLTAAKDVVVYSEPYTSILNDINGTSKSKKQSVTASMNLFNKRSEFIGNIAFDLDLKSISDTINNKKPPYNGKFLITSMTGDVVLSDNKIDILRKKVPASWIDRANNVEGEFYDSDENVYVFYKTYMNPDWFAFTVVSESDYYDITSTARQTFWIVTLSCLVFYMLMIFLAKLYMEKIVTKLYMGMNGFDAQTDKITIGAIYENIKKSKENLDKAVYNSMIDGLTDIYNRRRFDEDMGSLVDDGKSFYLAIIDIDDFKKINDTYGHDVGDNVLQTVSKIGSQVLGDKHGLYRFGGEELCAIYVGEDHDYFYQLIDTWLKMISLRRWGDTELRVTFSAGIAKCSATGSATEVLKKADANLYRAKMAGKNQILGAS